MSKWKWYCYLCCKTSISVAVLLNTPLRGTKMRRSPSLIMIISPQCSLGFVELGLCLVNNLSALLQALLVVRFFFTTRPVPMHAQLLDLITRIHYLYETQCSRRAFQEVPEHEDSGQVSCFPMTVVSTLFRGSEDQREDNYRLESISWNVVCA